MAKKNKKMLLIGAAAIAAFYFWNKKKQKENEEFVLPTKAKAPVVNSPLQTMASATPKMFNPVNNALNNFTAPKVITPTKVVTAQKITTPRKGNVDTLNGVSSIF